jgi:hypothetical protein
MKNGLFVLLLLCTPSLAQDPLKEECVFVRNWANMAFHIARSIGLEEQKWLISQDDISDERFAIILEIKKEAYHDLPALRSRVEKACGITS